MKTTNAVAAPAATSSSSTSTEEESSSTTNKNKASDKAFLSVSSDKKPYEKITAKDPSMMSEAELTASAVKKTPVTNGKSASTKTVDANKVTKATIPLLPPSAATAADIPADKVAPPSSSSSKKVTSKSESKSTSTSKAAPAGPDGCPTCSSDADCAAVGYGPCVNGKCQPKTATIDASVVSDSKVGPGSWTGITKVDKADKADKDVAAAAGSAVTSKTASTKTSAKDSFKLPTKTTSTKTTATTTASSKSSKVSNEKTEK